MPHCDIVKIITFAFFEKSKTGIEMDQLERLCLLSMNVDIDARDNYPFVAIMAFPNLPKADPF
jgi:hypothetical protein